MAFPCRNQVLSLKVALISTGVLSAAVMLKLSAPVIKDFAVSELPVIYTSVLSWLQPPYLYLVINCIIIFIFASSKFQLQKADVHNDPDLMTIPSGTVVSEAKVSCDHVQTDYIHGTVLANGYTYHDLSDAGKVVAGDAEKVEVDDALGTDGREEVMVVDGGDEATVQPPQRSDSLEFLFEKLEKEKPLVSARFGHKKLTVRPNPEAGKTAALGVSKPKRHDTLESTWKMITDGRPMPLARHLKKSDTWETHGRRDEATTPPPPPRGKMNKSETFSESKSRVGKSPRGSAKLRRDPDGSGKLRRDPSLSQDELNRRVEAFIKKINEEMRLQRQESLNQYQEMISRGAH